MNRVRLAQKTDLPLLPAIEKSADQAFEEFGMSGLPGGATVDELESASYIFVIGDPIVGFARLDDIDGHAHLEQISVDKQHAGRGLGGELLEETCLKARRLGYSAMSLITFRNVPWNEPFYAKHGFVVLSSLPDYLQKLRKHEQEIGLDSYGERVVMQRALI